MSEFLAKSLEIAQTYWPLFLSGTRVTLILSISGTLIGLVIGLLVGSVRAVGVEPTVDIAYSTAGLEPGDILLLCSDGLYNMLDPATLRACVRQAAAQDDGRCLMDAANARGGKDNITAVIIHYEENENG